MAPLRRPLGLRGFIPHPRLPRRSFLRSTLCTVAALSVSSALWSVPSAQAADKMLIGLSLDTLKEERWQGDRDLFVKRDKELGADVLVQSANSDDVRQIKDVEVLVILPRNGEVMAKAVDMAHQANIPVLSYDRLIRNAKVDLYMTFDNVKVGEFQASYLKDKVPAGGKLRMVRICGSKTDNNARLFKQGQDNIIGPLVKEGKFEVVRDDWADDWKPENAKRITNAAITQVGKNFAAVPASNDGTAGEAIRP